MKISDILTEAEMKEISNPLTVSKPDMEMEEGIASDLVKGAKRLVKGKQSPDSVRRKYWDKSQSAIRSNPDPGKVAKAQDDYIRVAKVTNPKQVNRALGK